MALFHFHPSLSLPPFPTSSSSFNPNPKPKPKLNPTHHHPPSLPARDRTIDFGRHKGRMLGTLPSSYLSWISSTLRAADSLHWAHLADEVLSDPVYRDRIEWEFTQNLLTGNSSNTSRAKSISPVSDLLELSQRFGWDNEDKAGWARIDFELLGTSKGGRIPRVGDSGGNGGDEKGLVRVGRGMLGGSGKREERRERRRGKSGKKLGFEEMEVEVVRKKLGFEEENEGRLEMRMKKKKSGVNESNPFPGRGALLDKIGRGGGVSD